MTLLYEAEAPGHPLFVRPPDLPSPAPDAAAPGVRGGAPPLFAVGPLDLGTLGGSWSLGLAISRSDPVEVTGVSETASGACHRFRWRDGRMTDLGALDRGTRGLDGMSCDSPGIRANLRGDLIGVAVTGGRALGFRWREGVRVTLLDLGGGESRPADLDAWGRVAGSARTPSGAFHACLWEVDWRPDR